VISARRVGRARHEFRFAGRELVVLGAVFCLILSLVFAVGVVVGRETARAKGGPRGEAVREHRLPDPEGLRGLEAPAKTAAARAEEKVTFYRTLTAPTQDLPQIGKPTIEERLVPKDEAPPSAPPAADVVPEAPRAAAEPPRAAPERRAPKAPEAAPGPRPARGAQAPTRPGPAQTATAEADAWTVQVSAFRSRALAENLRARLAARGLDAYVFPSITEDGRPRYRVRVGTYAARSDAERVAADLRSERGLSPLVTPRAR
jgi:cell division protein FtsN